MYPRVPISEYWSIPEEFVGRHLIRADENYRGHKSMLSAILRYMHMEWPDRLARAIYLLRVGTVNDFVIGYEKSGPAEHDVIDLVLRTGTEVSQYMPRLGIAALHVFRADTAEWTTYLMTSLRGKNDDSNYNIYLLTLDGNEYSAICL